MMLVRGLHSSVAVVAIATIFLSACGDDPPPDPVRPDAHTAHDRDGGVVVPFDAEPRDAGSSPLDAEVRDGGFDDAGTIRDGGHDAGVEEQDPPILETHSGGQVVAVHLANGLAYVGVGPRLTIWDIAQRPVRLGESAPLSGLVTSIAVRGDRAYVTTVDTSNSHLHVIDTSTTSNPVEIGVLRLGAGNTSRLVATRIDGTRLFVSDAEQGIYILDLSNPDRPEHETVIVTFHVVDMRIHAGRLYAASETFSFERAVEAFDLETHQSVGRAALGVVGTELLPGGLLLVRGLNGATIEDLSTLPTLTRLYTSPVVPVYASAADDQDGVWLTVDGQLRRLDFSNRAAIVASPAYGSDLFGLTTAAAANGRLLLADYQSRLEAFDTTSGVTSLGEVGTGACSYCYSATTWGQRMVITETAPGAVGRVTTLRADDLDAIGQHLEFTVDFEDIVVDGDRAYVADWFTGLWVFDLSNIAEPSPIATVATGGYPSALAFAGDYIVVAEGSGGGALRVFSRDGERGPIELGAISTAFGQDVAADGTIVYFAASPLGTPGGLYVYDIADPSDIQLIAFYDACDAAVSVALEGTRAVVACENGVHVLDVSVPAAPTPLSVWLDDGPRSAGPIALEGDRFFVGLGDGVYVVDIVDPTQPALVEVLPTAWLPWHVAVGRGRVVASVYSAGLYQWPSRASRP